MTVGAHLVKVSGLQQLPAVPQLLEALNLHSPRDLCINGSSSSSSGRVSRVRKPTIMPLCPQRALFWSATSDTDAACNHVALSVTLRPQQV